MIFGEVINVIDIGNERIQCMEFMRSSRKLLIVSVYMLCKGPQNHVLEFQECVDILYEITQTYCTSHIIVFGRDFNEDIINALSSTYFPIPFKFSCISFNN
jgi:hypothetical protein